MFTYCLTNNNNSRIMMIEQISTTTNSIKTFEIIIIYKIGNSIISLNITHMHQ